MISQQQKKKEFSFIQVRLPLFLKFVTLRTSKTNPIIINASPIDGQYNTIFTRGSTGEHLHKVVYSLIYCFEPWV